MKTIFNPNTNDHIAKAVAFLAVSVLMIASMNALAKYLGDTHHPIELTFYRNIVILAGLSLWLYLSGQWHLTKTDHLPGQIHRSAVGTAGVVFAFWAVGKLPLAEATTILYAAPLFVTILSYPMLGEKVGLTRAGAVCAGFCGVLIVAQPAGHNLLALDGVALALAGAFFHALTQIQLRKMGKVSNPITTVFYFMLIGTILTGLCMPFVYTAPPDWHAAPFLLLLAATGILQQIFKTVAYGLAPVASITPVNYIGLVFAVLLGFIVWGEVPALAFYIGAGLIIASNLFIVYREHVLKQRQSR